MEKSHLVEVLLALLAELLSAKLPKAFPRGSFSVRVTTVPRLETLPFALQLTWAQQEDEKTTVAEVLVTRRERKFRFAEHNAGDIVDRLAKVLRPRLKGLGWTEIPRAARSVAKVASAR